MGVRLTSEGQVCPGVTKVGEAKDGYMDLPQGSCSHEALCGSQSRWLAPLEAKVSPSPGRSRSLLGAQETWGAERGWGTREESVRTRA